MRSLPHLCLTLVALAGCSEYAYTERTVTDYWEQPAVESVADVLFVVDNSASMAEEQERLGANFEAFVEVVTDSYADFRIGVITTDVAEAGALRGEVLTPTTEDLASAFLEQVAVGTKGDKDEQGLATAVMAFSANPDFSRPEAQLNVAVISDEDDHSPEAIDDYLNPLKDVSDVGFALHAVVGDLPDGCASGTSAASPGERYITAVDWTGGYRDSICSDDYTGILTRIGLDISGLSDTFALSEVPEPETITVWVDGVEIPGREMDGWRWEPGENVIVFDGYAVPRPGMEIVAEYQLLLGNEVDSGG